MALLFLIKKYVVVFVLDTLQIFQTKNILKMWFLPSVNSPKLFSTFLLVIFGKSVYNLKTWFLKLKYFEGFPSLPFPLHLNEVKFEFHPVCSLLSSFMYNNVWKSAQYAQFHFLMYSSSKKKRNTSIYFNANYRREMKLVPIIMDYCLL